MKAVNIAMAALWVALFYATAFAQEKPKIALYIANDGLKPNEKTVLTNKFLAPFTASGMYSLIDRTDIFTQKVMQERIKQHDGSVNEKEIYKIGYEAGAKYVCMVQVENAFGKWNFAARMVDVVTAEIYLALGETDIKGELADADISGAAKIVFDQIHGKGSTSRSGSAATQTPTPRPQSNINYGSLRDNRDGKTYKTVVIGGKKWMAENLNYLPPTGKSWCYENNNPNCGKYGRLYDWNTAGMVCPKGWHLPSRQEWNDLITAIGGKAVAGGEKLKARSGWNEHGNGTDEYGFFALPGGRRNSSDDSFTNVGRYGYWWTATAVAGSVFHVYYRDMGYRDDDVNENGGVKGYGFSVRCRMDKPTKENLDDDLASLLNMLPDTSSGDIKYPPAHPYLNGVRNKIESKSERISHNSKTAVVVSFEIHSDGSAHNIRVKSSSGDANVDNWGKNAVIHAAPFGKLPWPDKNMIDVDITLRPNRRY